MTSAILRLYQEFVDAADCASRSMDQDRRHILRIEAEICAQLANQPDGTIITGNMHFRLHVVKIGKDQSLAYFVATVYQERSVDATGYSFARRRPDGPDVIPVSAQHRPSQRRREIAP